VLVEGGRVSEPGMAPFALQGFDPRVNPLVIFQGWLDPEPFAAHLALMLLEVGVRRHMVAQGVGVPKGLVAHGAHVRSDPSVNRLVIFQRVFQGEAAVAHIASVWLDARVNFHVASEGALIGKLFLTNFALERFLDDSAVSFLVGSQGLYLLEGPVARGTRERPVFTVHSIVANQALHQGEAFVTHGAGVGSVSGM